MIYLIRLFRLITGRASLITKSSTRPQTLSIDTLRRFHQCEPLL